MWLSGHRKDKEIPYRGQPPRKFPKRRRQARDLKAERRENIVAVLSITFILLIVVGFFIFRTSDTQAEFLQRSLVILIFIVPLILAIISGLKSVNKYQKGYDFDISHEAEKVDEKKSETPPNAVD